MKNNLKKESLKNWQLQLGLYLLSFACMAWVLFYARRLGLLPRPIPGTDQLGMLDAAESLCRGRLWGAEYMYSPLYTLFLSLCSLVSGGNLFIMRLLQAALCALIPVYIFRLGLLVRLGRNSSVLAALLYCFYGPAALVSLSFLRAGPLALCFLLLLYFLAGGFIRRSSWRWFAAGIFAGCCVLGRENFIPLVVLPAALLIFKDVRRNIDWRKALIYLGGAVIAVLPFVLFNLIRFGSPAIVPGHVANVVGAYHGERAVEDSATALTSIVKNVPAQICNFWCSYEIPNSLSFYAHREMIPFLRILIIPFNLLIALGLVGVLALQRNRGVLLLALMTAGYGGTMVFFCMFYRFRIPAVPLLVLLAGAGLTGFWRWWRGRKYLKFSVFAVLTIVVFLTTWSAPDRLRPAKEMRSTAALLIRLGRYRQAEDYIEKLRRLGKSEKELELYLVKTLYRAKRFPEVNRLLFKWHPNLIYKKSSKRSSEMPQAGGRKGVLHNNLPQ